MSLRHHDQLQFHQKREQELLDALREVSDTLDDSLSLIGNLTGNNPNIVPQRMQNVARKYSTKNASTGATQNLGQTPQSSASTSRAQLQSQASAQPALLLSLPNKLEPFPPPYSANGYIPNLFSQNHPPLPYPFALSGPPGQGFPPSL
jgi:hypothetical protein